MDKKYNINESFTDVLFHFTTFAGAFYIVKYDRFFLTNIIDAAREKQFNRDKLYYMSFARHFNSTMGYVGGRNEGTKFGSNYLNVRIEIDGRILSYNHKAVNVNNVGKAEDIVTNRQQEERLISDEPEVRDAHKYIKGIYIFNPNVSNPNKNGKRVDNLRKRILFMMSQPHYERKIFVFDNEEAFNNIPMALSTGAFVEPELIRKLAINPAEEPNGNEIETTLLLSPKAVVKAAPIILCGEEDISAEHGSTIGKLSNEMLFYMNSRGIDQKTAEDLLTNAKVTAAAAAIAGVVIFRKRSSKLQNDFTEVLRNVQGLFAW